MAQQGPQIPPPDDSEQGSGPKSGKNEPGWPKWSLYLLVAAFLGVMVVAVTSNSEDGTEVPYSAFRQEVQDGNVAKIEYDNPSGNIDGTYKNSYKGGETFKTTALQQAPEDVLSLASENDVELEPKTPGPSFFATWLPLLLPFLFFGGLLWLLNRRASGQMGNIMSIGRSKAKTYSTERPGTTFADVAGYEGVKTEINEVVDFLKHPERFGQIGARIPKGILLVGPPGTGKTLIARAVAGEAGVPFLSVSGSDFMEMFVGVGASRVRDLFQSAKKMGRAIIFIDEIDSIGRKRGAGLGGGHDEREQTLNQMLNEMDGFEATEGIVMMAATNRPDILDSALLRPGRFDRQVVVPLPEQTERLAILNVHTKGKRMSSELDLNVVARGTPGMSGAELSNLVNEAALHAVRQGRQEIGNEDFEYARDRVLMGARRESMALSDAEKELTAYHEAGHAVCASLMENADPLHKVTILPIGMALGVTQQLPVEDRHSYSQHYLEDSIVVAMGGRVAEQLVFGVMTTGAGNDLEVSTSRAKRMVTEWGMSTKVGPQAWGNHGQVFLGEDLMQSRDSSGGALANIIDQEIERILREAEERCRTVLTGNRAGLNLVARSLLEHETVDGATVSRLVRMAREGAPTPAETTSVD